MIQCDQVHNTSIYSVTRWQKRNYLTLPDGDISKARNNLEL